MFLERVVSLINPRFFRFNLKISFYVFTHFFCLFSCFSSIIIKLSIEYGTVSRCKNRLDWDVLRKSSSNEDLFIHNLYNHKRI